MCCVPRAPPQPVSMTWAGEPTDAPTAAGVRSARSTTTSQPRPLPASCPMPAGAKAPANNARRDPDYA